MMRLKLNFSTYPNDTFMFGALVLGKIDTKGLQFDVHLADIDELNKSAEQGIPDISKLSYGAVPFVANKYQLLTSGSALGSGVGPLVVSKRKIYPDEIPFARIALPGDHTTAHLLFNLAYPNVLDKKFYLFSDIMDVVLSNAADIGVVIHESRFTYEQKGLLKIADLGDFWETKTGLPTPLGGILIRRSFQEDLKNSINQMIKDSVEYAFKRPNDIMPYVTQFAQEMEMDVILKHIALYVNNYSLELGEKGKGAVVELLKSSAQLNSNFDVSDFFVG